MANPVAFCLDEKGRVFVAETHRYRSSVLDIRHYMFMLEDDLACRTVQDRVEMVRRNFGNQFSELEQETEIIRLLEDRNGDGRADFSSIYADGFNSVLDGIASGVLARKGKVYFTNIPHLWELEGIDANGRAIRKASMSYGYGVRFSLTGHDMHGLAIGPDGKLYFSNGDRGATVVTKELKLLPYPDEGAVFRCNLDGTELEVVHRGLRNPQELAFDNYGNLFTGDNDFDHGDEERLVQIAEGGDSGWRVGYQHAPLGFELVPWNFEHIWVAHNSRQADYNGETVANPIADTGVRPAAYLPPVSNVGNGPSGLVYYPGTGLPGRYDNHFFLCHFKGNIVNSKIQAFSVKAKGATFELDNSEFFSGQMQPTDLEFGPDGALYFADWGQGWTKQKKGRIYRIVHAGAKADAVVRQTREILSEGFEQREIEGLIGLLGHKDRRVRQEAHLEMAARGTKSVPALAKAAKGAGSQLARIHAIWGLGVIGQQAPWVLENILGLQHDEDPEIRAQLAKVIGEAKYAKGGKVLVTALGDKSARVRYHAGMALVRIRHAAAYPAVVAMLKENNEADAYLQHAGVMALIGNRNHSQLKSAAGHRSAAVRMAALVAMRKMELPDIAMFLRDRDPRLILEAARAINDVPIDGARGRLADLLNKMPAVPEEFSAMLALRVINANFRIGGMKQAGALAAYAGNTKVAPELRAEALFALGTWGNPHPRDRVVGVYRPVGGRGAGAAIAALRPGIGAILKTAPEPVRLAAIKAAVNLRLLDSRKAIHAISGDRSLGAAVRSAALEALAALKSPALSAAIEQALAQDDESIRATAVGLVGNLRVPEALQHLRKTLTSGSTPEQQMAFAALAVLKSGEADKIIGDWMERLNNGKVAAALQLDVLTAAGQRKTKRLKDQVAAFNKKSAAGDELQPWRIALAGGDARRGEEIFKSRRDVQCARCHKIGSKGGEAGPDLTTIGARQNREYLLEALVAPSAKIAAGFENIQVEVKGGPEDGGAEFAGVVKRETETEIELVSFEDGSVIVEKKDITFRRQGLSGMPVGLHAMLGKENLRDLIEYLANLK